MFLCPVLCSDTTLLVNLILLLNNIAKCYAFLCELLVFDSMAIGLELPTPPKDGEELFLTPPNDLGSPL